MKMTQWMVYLSMLFGLIMFDSTIVYATTCHSSSGECCCSATQGNDCSNGSCCDGEC